MLALAAGMLAGCGPAKPVLHLYNWADYISPELIRQFESDNRCRVVTDTFDSNEAMFAKLKAGATGYDLVFPSSYIVGIMRAEGMLQPIQRERVPNLANLDPAYMRIVADPQFTYSVPYMISNAGLAYRKSRCPDFIASWAMLDNAAYKGRMTMLNDMRETIGAALKFLGCSLNSTNAQEVAAARDVVIRWKRNLAKFENEQYKNGIASGEFLVVHGYNGDICQVIEENDDIVYAAPKEGVSLACDEMVIPKDARQVELAHRFINYLHEPAVAAKNIAFVFYLCPNVGAYALLDEETRADESIFLPEAIQSRSESIRDLGVQNALYIRAWDEIKAAQ
jgi:spermidine/putrescine transport system substrate-binding protein